MAEKRESKSSDTDEIEKTLLELEVKLAALRSHRDHFFQNNPIENAANRYMEVGKNIEDIIKDFELVDESTLLGPQKAKFFFMKGKAYNSMPEYNPLATQCLSRAIKLSPRLIEAWNELGESYWKQGKIRLAKNCFQASLKHGKDKVTFRNLSIILRQEANTEQSERENYIKQSLQYAKDAVTIDPKDGLSWAVLGNAYLYSFFIICQDPMSLKLCMTAYKVASSDVVAKAHSDLHYNKGVALIYNEQYLEALQSYEEASRIDPTWGDPVNELKRVLQFLTDVQDLYTTHGKIRPKKLHKMTQSIQEKSLGPYAGDSYIQGGTKVQITRKPLADLQVGLNSNAVILGCVVGSVHSENPVTFTFCIVDSNGSCIVSLYNLVRGKGVIIGDIVAIPEPFLMVHQFQYEDKEFNYRCIRVDNPLLLVVNGKRFARESVAGTSVTSTQNLR